MINQNFKIHEMGEYPLWEMEIEEMAGESLEAKNRTLVNELLARGWILLLVYVLKYKEKDIWREKPMAILGRPRGIRTVKQKVSKH